MSTEEERDAQLLSELTELFAHAEEPPELVVQLAKATFSMHSVDAELALLTWDSTADAGVAMRSGGAADLGAPPHGLTFEFDDVAVEVEVTAPRRGWRLIGQLTAEGSPSMELHHCANASAAQAGDFTVAEVPVDDLGRFSITDVAAGLARLLVRRQGHPPIITEWFRVD